MMDGRVCEGGQATSSFTAIVIVIVIIHFGECGVMP